MAHPTPPRSPRDPELSDRVRSAVAPWLAALVQGLAVGAAAGRRAVVVVVAGLVAGYRRFVVPLLLAAWAWMRQVGLPYAVSEGRRTGMWIRHVAPSRGRAAGRRASAWLMGTAVPALLAGGARIGTAVRGAGRAARRGVAALGHQVGALAIGLAHDLQTFEQRRRARDRIRAQPLPDADAAWLGAAPGAREREDDRPWLVKAGVLVLGVVAGAFGIIVMTSALGPRLAADVTGSVEVALELPEDTSLPGLQQRSVIYAADGSRLAVLHDEVDRRVVPLKRIPKHVQLAIITAEDRRFFEHEGYDLEGIGRAALANAQARSISQGGSTITQQIAKNNFVGDAVTLERKVSELLYAMALEEQMTKEQLLGRYLNQVYFGGGAYGVQAASQEFFRKPVGKLKVHEAALLAGMIRSPSGNDPRHRPKAARTVRNRVLDDMANEGHISEKRARKAKRRKLGISKRRERKVREPYVVEFVKREFFSNPAFGATRQERIDRLFGGGLEIHTTIDPDMQRSARKIVGDAFPQQGGVTAALASVDPATGAIRAMHSGEDFEEAKFDLATQGRRQPGSAFKTFVMAEALRQGFPPTLTLSGSSPAEIPYDRGRRIYEVENYGGFSYGQIEMTEAIASSINTYFAQLVRLVGEEKAFQMAGRFGINQDRAFGENRGDYGPAIVLGGLLRGVTPLEMASAYGTFGNNGVHVEPYLVQRVVDDGEDILDRRKKSDRVLGRKLNAVVVDMLSGVVEGGTGTAAAVPGWDVIGKTGTTDNNSDVWFAGATPKLATAVWVGNPKGSIFIGEGATGGGTAAPLWSAFMTRALSGMDPVTFPDVDYDLAELFDADVKVPDVLGEPEDDALRALARRKLIGVPQSVYSTTAAGTVVWQSPSAGNEATTGDDVYLGVSNGQPPPPPPKPKPKPKPDPKPTDDDGGDEDKPKPDPKPSDDDQKDDDGGGSGGGNNGDKKKND